MPPQLAGKRPDFIDRCQRLRPAVPPGRRRVSEQIAGPRDNRAAARCGPLVVLSFRSAFFVLGWGRDAMGMVLDDGTDWDEVRELVTESF